MSESNRALASVPIPVVSRTFGEGETTVVLELFAPYREADAAGEAEGHAPFKCRYEVVSGSERRSSEIYGVDSFQAFLLALGVAAVEARILAGRVGLDPAEMNWADVRSAADALSPKADKRA
jgi:hypothetical protein